jgi:hypothetical protein
MKRTYLDKIRGKIDKLFQDDLISEVCSVYSQLVLDRELTESSKPDLLKEYHELFDDVDNGGHYTWIALAYLQFELGIQDEDIKNKALSIIESELKLTQDTTKLSKHQLQKLKETLLSPPRKEIVFEKPRYFTTKWKIGDVFSLRLNNREYIDYNLQGRYVLIINVGYHIIGSKNVCPKIVCLNWHGEEPLLDLSQIRELDVLPIYFFGRHEIYKIYVVVDDEEQLRKVKLNYIGNITDLSLPDDVARDINNENHQPFNSIESLDSMMIPIYSFEKRSIQINPDGCSII